MTSMKLSKDLIKQDSNRHPKFYACTSCKVKIDHFHYDVTRAKVSGSCSKDRAQCRAIAGKCQKISKSVMSAKASYQVFHKVMCSIAIQIQRNSEWRFLCFFSINEELRRVLLTNISMENFYFQILITGKRVLTMCQYNFPHEKKNRRGGESF